MTDPRNSPSSSPLTSSDAEGQEHVKPTQARGASKEGVVRWVLIASMVLIVVGLLFVVLTAGS